MLTNVVEAQIWRRAYSTKTLGTKEGRKLARAGLLHAYNNNDLNRLSRDAQTAMDREHEWSEDEPLGSCPLCTQPYHNLAVHAWFRHSLKGEYDERAGKMVCLVCGLRLNNSLHLWRHSLKHSQDEYAKAIVLAVMSEGAG